MAPRLGARMENTERSNAAPPAGAPEWDLTAMTSAYCNVAAATSARESVVIHLGITQGAATAEVIPELLHRVLLAPRTAAHLHQVLGTLLGEYEAQRGEPR